MRQFPMLAAARSAAADTAAIQAMPKQRLCLRCSTPFSSAWAGERICVQCKGTAAWRQGAPLRTHPASGR